MKMYKMQLIGVAGLLASLPVFAATSVFDDFSTLTSMDKYWGMEETIELDTTNQNLVFVAKARSYSTNTRANNLLLDDATVTTLQADLSLSEASLSNPDTQQVLLSVAGTFYNSNSASPTTSLGEVFVRVAIGDRGNGLEAWYELQESTAPDWSTGTITEASLGAISLNTVYTASLSYDGDNTFSVVFNNGAAINFDGSPRMGNAFEPVRYLNNRIRFGQDNSTPTLYDELPDTGEPASIVGRVDNVVTQAGLVDDFSGADINQGSWQADQTSVAVDNEGLVMKVTGQGSQITERFFVKQKGLDAFGADVTLLGTSTINSTTRVRGRLAHYLSNDTYDDLGGDTPNGLEGNVWTQYFIERSGGNNRVIATAVRVKDETFDTEDDLFFENLGPINLDQAYTLLIEKTGTLVEYKLDGVVLHSFDLATDYNMILSGNDYEPVGGTESSLQVRVQNDAGEVQVRFDNIVTDYMPPVITLNAFNADDDQIPFPAVATVNEGEVIDLVAAANNPSQVMTQIWDQTSGTDVIVARGNVANRVVGTDSTLSFTVPPGTDMETLSFKLTTVDNAGFEINRLFDIGVDNSAESTLATSSDTGGSDDDDSSSSGGAFNPFLIIVVWLFAFAIARVRSDRN